MKPKQKTLHFRVIILFAHWIMETKGVHSHFKSLVFDDQDRLMLTTGGAFTFPFAKINIHF